MLEGEVVSKNCLAVIINPKPVTFEGGGEKFALLLGDVLQKEGWNVEFARPLGRVPSQIDLLVLNGAQGTGLLWARRWIERSKWVWVIPHEALRQEINMLGIYPGRLLDEIVAGILPLAFKYWTRHRGRRVTLIAVGQQNALHLKEWFGTEPEYIPNGVGNLVFEESSRVRGLLDSIQKKRGNLAAGKWLGLIVSRWDYTKNPEGIVKIARSTPENVRLIVRSTPDGLFALRKRLGLLRWPPLTHPRVTWVEYPFSRGEVLALMRDSDFLLVPSKYESFSYVALEAAAVGTLPFLTPVGLGWEFSKDPLLARLILPLPPHGRMTVSESWQQILSVLSDEPLVRELKSALRELSMRYSLENWEDRIRGLLYQDMEKLCGRISK